MDSTLGKEECKTCTTKSTCTTSKKVVFSAEKFDVVGSEMGKKELNGSVNPTMIFKTGAKIQITRDDLMKILQIENKIRLSESTLKKMDDQNNDMQKMYLVDEEVIMDSLEQYGFNPKEDDSLKAYLLATGKYINDPEVREMVVWMKYDKMKRGSFNLGDDYITKQTENTLLYTMNNERVLLKNLLADNKYNIIVSGSYS